MNLAAFDANIDATIPRRRELRALRTAEKHGLVVSTDPLIAITQARLLSMAVPDSVTPTHPEVA